MIDFGTKLYENGDVLRRYVRNNSIVALVFFPLAGVITFFKIDMSWDFGFWGFVFMVYAFYTASYAAFPEESEWGPILSLISTFMWMAFVGLVCVSSLFAQIWLRSFPL